MIQLRGAGYQYPRGLKPCPARVNLEIQRGEVVLLTGPTGCGKSTLLRLMAGLLQRHGQGQVFGDITVDGVAPGEMPPARRVERIGFVSQVPSDQIVSGTLGDEIAFALASAGWVPTKMEDRIRLMLETMGLPLDPERPVHALSGGQKQRLVVAAALAAGAHYLLMDEPTAHLDPEGAAELLRHLRGLAECGVSVVLVEHRLETCLPWCDRVVVMEDGLIQGSFSPASLDVALLTRLGLQIPGRVWPPAPAPAAGPELLVAERLRFSWPLTEQPALNNVSLRLRAGERLAVIGRNGAGKSTLLSALAGRLSAGPVRATGAVVDVPQDPDLALFCATVLDELSYGPTELGAADVPGIVRQVAEVLSVTPLLHRPPQALSRGQRLRVAVAAALACQPAVLILDEPTAGQDHDQVERMMEGLCHALSAGALVFATHDRALARRYATRVLMMEGGQVVFDGRPEEAPWTPASA